MALQITQVGLNKAVQASANGISLEITHVAFGASGYNPSRNQTSLQNEILRRAVAGGNNVAPNQVHLTTIFEEGTQFTAREIGFYLTDGTLFAVDSHPTDILVYKDDTAKCIEAFDLILDAVPPDSITVNTSGDLSLYYAEEFAKFAISTLIISNEQTQQNNRILENKESIRVKHNQFKQFEKAIADFKNQVLSGKFYANEFSQFAFTTIKNANLITEQQQQLADQQQQINALKNAVNQLSPTNLFN